MTDISMKENTNKNILTYNKECVYIKIRERRMRDEGSY